MTTIDKIVKGDIAPRDTGVLWLNTEDNIIYVFRNGWIKTSTGAAASVYTGTEAERLAIEDPFNGLEFHQVDNDGKVTRYLYDMNSWTIVIDPAEYIIRADQDHARAEADHTAASNDHSAATQDHSLAVVDHQNAVDDHAQYLVDHESIAHKANVDGYYAQMTVGAAENLVGDSEETYTFTTQMTGGEVEFGSGAGQLTKVQGNGLAWNQLVQNGDFSNGTTGWGCNNGSHSVIDGIYTYIPDLSATSGRYCANKAFSIPVSHKVLATVKIKATNGTTIGFNGVLPSFVASGDFEYRKSIYTTDSTTTYFNIMYMPGYELPENAKVEVQYIQIIDLSLIYGLGNEPTTVAEAEARLAALTPQKPYYQYNAGELFGTKVLHLISYGQNLLNPANGQAQLAPYAYESVVNKYGIAAKDGVTLGTITFTPDATGVAETITPDSNGQFTISGAGTLSVAVSAGSLSDVYVWAVYDGAKDGIENYVPFSQDALEIKVSEIYGKLNGAGDMVKVFSDDVMRATGILPTSVRDLVDVASKEADVNVGKVDLGTLDLTYNSTYTFFRSDYMLEKIKLYPSYEGGFDGICTKYIADAWSNRANGKMTYGYYIGAGLFLFDYDKTDQDLVDNKAPWLNGVLLWYELATPLHYTDLKLSSDGGTTFQDLPSSIVVDNWGVWEQKPSESITPATGHDFEGIAATISTILPMDAVEILKSVQDNGIMTSEQRAQLTSILTALQTAGIIGSFTIAETPTDKVFPITITAPVEPESEP